MLAYFRADFTRDDGPALNHVLRFILVEQLLKLEDRTVEFRCLERRNQMIDDNRKPATLRLEPFANSIHGIKVDGWNRTNDDVGEIKLRERDLFAWQPFIAGMPADVDDDVSFEYIANVFVKSEVLMMRRNHI